LIIRYFFQAVDRRAISSLLNSISTASNSNAGRFGAKDAQLFLGSPATVAASAIAGQITDPRKLAPAN